MPINSRPGFLHRLPVYLLLDCSHSMKGAPIIAVNEGLGMIYRELNRHPQAVETVHISVICFSNQADQYSLVPIDEFVPPRLVAEGVTAMSAAFQILVDSIEHDLIPNTQTQHGDWRPLVFLLTDGVPTDASGNPSDNYKSELRRLKALAGNRKPTIVALGCGNEAQISMLHEVTDNVFLMENVTPEALRAFFVFISDSIQAVTVLPAGGGGDDSTIFMPHYVANNGFRRHY